MAEWSRAQITVNGKTYSSIDEMPPDVRKQYARAMSLLADKDGNGVPDIMEGGAMPPPLPPGEGTDVSVVTMTDRSFVNGREVPPGELPPQFQRLQFPESSRDPVIYMRPWTLIALLATVAVVGAALMWWVMQ
jgi:hypothetical protein